MPIRIRESNSISILDIEGRIDINSSEIVEMVGWLVNSGKVNIIFNLENVDIVDYNGLSILAIAYKNILNHKGKLRFLNVPLPVIELFKVVKLESVFQSYTDEETAINSFYDDEIEKLNLRRKFQRLDIHIDIKYKIVSGQKNPKVFEGKILNLSAVGMYVYTQYTFPVNTVLDMEFVLPNAASPLEAAGRVSWVADKEIQPHSYPGMGVSFTHLTPEKERAIADFIEKNITHRADSL